MIVRILHDGQYELAEADATALSAIDERIDKALSANDVTAFTAALDDALTTVRETGQRLPDDDIKPSDLVLPPAGSTLDEVHELLSSEA